MADSQTTFDTYVLKTNTTSFVELIKFLQKHNITWTDPETYKKICLGECAEFKGCISDDSLGAGTIGLTKLSNKMLDDTKMQATHDTTDCVAFNVHEDGIFSINKIRGVDNVNENMKQQWLIARKALIRINGGGCCIGGDGFKTVEGTWTQPQTNYKCHPIRFNLFASGPNEIVNLPVEVRKDLGIPNYVLKPHQATGGANKMKYVFMAHNPKCHPDNLTDMENASIEYIINKAMYHTNDNLRDFARALCYIRQGGFKYTEEKNMNGCYVAVRSGSYVLGIAENEKVAPLKTGLRTYLPIHDFMTENMRPVSIQPLLNMGFTRYAMFPSGNALLIINRTNSKPYIWHGAPYGAFVERDNTKKGAHFFAFGVDEKEQIKANAANIEREGDKCIICFEGSATHGYNTILHKIYCSRCSSLENVINLTRCPKSRKNVENASIVEIVA